MLLIQLTIFFFSAGYIGTQPWIYFGSAFAFIAAGVYMILIVVRTALEDRTLQKELTGYAEYAKKVRYKLFQWIW